MNETTTKLRIAISAGLLMLLLAAQAMSLLAPLDRFLADKRFSFVDRPVSGQIVFVAIDKESLDKVGVWPWPRSVHADITDRLGLLGALDIVFDIDFSTPSTPENDAAFVAAIEGAGGAVTLPVFLQHGDAAPDNRSKLITQPIAALADHAWLASVNVFPDSDGRVRRFPTGMKLDGDFIASVPASIAGGILEDDGQIAIDFGIDLASFEVISAADLLDGTVDPAAIAGRTVVVGAFATELRDFYTVPKLGFIPGAVMQGIAAETLIADRNLKHVDAMAIAVPAFLLLLALQFGLRRRTPIQTIAAYAAIPLVAEPVAIALYMSHALIVPTAFVHVAVLTALGSRLTAMTEFFRKLSREARTDASNLRQVLQQVVRENFDAIVITDSTGRILEASETIRETFDIGDAAPVKGTPAVQILPEEICRDIDEAITAARTGEAERPETKIVSLAGPDRPFRAIEYTIAISELRGDGAIRGRTERVGRGPIVAFLTARDITERLSQQEKLQQMSDYDDMTGTWRRHAFLRYIEATFAAQGSGGFAIVALNLHRFKTVNVALGRDTGNAVLRAAAERIRKSDEQVFGTARLDGDTFAILIGGIFTDQQAHEAADRFAAIVSAPYPVERGDANIGVRAGVTLCGGSRAEDPDAEILLDRAEIALDEARLASGSNVVVYDSAMAGKRMRSRIIERDLWQALDRDEIHLAYQVQVSLTDRTPCGAEALVRWSHPDLGNVRPDEFVPIAEANGFITMLGRWILFTACREAAQWPEEIPISVNVAPQQFERDGIVDDVRTALAETGLAPERLVIEIVESQWLETNEMVLDRIKALKALGVSIALDDFGTGYSGISYLSRLHFDKIKLDRQFVADLTTNTETQGIVRSVAVLGDAFNMTIVCEGIETREQETFLRLIGCDEGQGYLYSRPLDAAAFRALLAEAGGNAVEAATA